MDRDLSFEMELDSTDAPDTSGWNESFQSIDDLIAYHNDKASSHFYFYLLDKAKFITGDISDKLEDERKEFLEGIIEKEEKIEYIMIRFFLK